MSARKAGWHIALDKAAHAFADAVSSMTDDELFALQFAREHVTNSNCWFLSYILANTASDLAANELQLRGEASAIEARSDAAPKNDAAEGEIAAREAGDAR